MTSETEHFGLTKLGPGESIHSGSGKFPSADRDTIDDLLHAALNHTHDGVAGGAATAPVLAPELTPSLTGGSIPAGVTVRYVYTYTDPETGQTAASPEATYTTSGAVESPVAPTFTLQAIGGTLPPGQYFYVLTAYQTTSTVETKALYPVSVDIPIGTSTNQVELTLPALPGDTTGFNIYRRAPGDTRYYHLTTDGGGTYTDDGSVTPSTRSLPSANTTNGATSIEVSIPGATPSIPTGNTWTIYRSYTTSFLNSYLVNLGEGTPTYTDTGAATSPASPPASGFGSHSSGKIDLGQHTVGELPASQVSVDDSGFGTLVGTDAQTLFEYIDAGGGGGGGGGFATAYGGGVGTEVLTVVDDSGNGAFGYIYAGSPSTSEIAATSQGSFAWGQTYGYSGSTFRIRAQGFGSTATGRVRGSNYGEINAGGGGSFAQGFVYDGRILVSGYGAFGGGHTRYGGRISASGRGSISRGYSKSYSNNTRSRIYASGHGSAALGWAESSSSTGNGHIYASGKGSQSHGYVRSSSTSTSLLSASGVGSFASGSVRAVTGHTSTVEATNHGGFAHGFIYGYNGAALVQASAPGSVSFGSIWANGTVRATGYGCLASGHAQHAGIITAGTQRGAFAFGYALSGTITASGHGAMAGGHANAAGEDITASAAGSMAFGRTSGGFDITASANGSGAFGSTTTATISATAANAWQLGSGTNAQATSISVGAGVRINGAAAPTTPRNGDIWVASGHIYARTNGVTKSLTNI